MPGINMQILLKSEYDDTPHILSDSQPCSAFSPKMRKRSNQSRSEKSSMYGACDIILQHGDAESKSFSKQLHAARSLRPSCEKQI